MEPRGLGLLSALHPRLGRGPRPAQKSLYDVDMTPRAKNSTGRVVQIKGRDVEVRSFNEAQIALLMREASVMERTSADASRRMTAVGRAFDLFESLIVQPEDRDYLVDLVTAGSLELKDLVGLIGLPAEDAGTRPVVRRGRVRA